MLDQTPHDPRRLRVFIASPDDVRAERAIVERLVEQLDHDYGQTLSIELTRWEYEPLVASADYQSKIPPPRDADVVIVVVWTKLGRPLPIDSFPGPLSGGQVTGTEWEFEDALKAAHEHGRPEVLFYRRKAAVSVSLTDFAAAREQMACLERVEAFMGRWFGDGQDQPATAAHHAYAEPAEFEERCGVHLRRLVIRRLEQVRGQIFNDAEPALRPWEGSPFRGLLSFELEQAPIFHGRSRARAELRAALTSQIARGNAFVLVLGASGSGKSSLVKAGLLADLKAGYISPVTLCRHAILRPSDGGAGDPLAGLAAALRGPEALPDLAWDQAKVRETLRQAPETLLPVVAEALAAVARQAQLDAPQAVRLALVVDQFEELFTDNSLSVEERDRFVAALETLAGSGLVWVVATLRSDFFDRIETIPRLARLSEGEGRFLLLPPDAGELDQIIRLPARAAGVVFDQDPDTSEPLAETIRRAALAAAGGLPLLSYLLEQLWERRDPATNHLTITAYCDLGGLEGALGRKAEAVFAAQPAEVQSALPHLLRALTTIGQDSAARAAARWAPLTAFQPGSPAHRLAQAFLAPDVRLVLADGDRASVRLRVAHEALFSHWPRAAEQIAIERADLQFRTRLEQTAKDWKEAPAAAQPEHLLRGNILSSAEDLRERWGEDLADNPLVPELIIASAEVRNQEQARKRSEEQRWNRWTRIAAGVLAVLLVLAGTSAWFGWTGRNAAEAEKARAESEQQRAIQQEEEANRRLAVAQLNQSQFLTGKAQTANAARQAEYGALISLAGLPVTLDPIDRPFHKPLLAQLADSLRHDHLESILSGHDDGIISVAFNSDGTRAVTASKDKTARVWDSRTGRQIVVLRGHSDLLQSAEFSPDGSRVVTASHDKTARVWAVDSKLEILRLDHNASVIYAKFHHDGSHIVTVSRDNMAYIWDIQTKQKIATLGPLEFPIIYLEFSQDGTRIVAVSGRKAYVWDAATGKQIAVLDDKTSKTYLSVAKFCSNGSMVATAGTDTSNGSNDGNINSVTIWDVKTGKNIFVLKGHKGIVRDVSFSKNCKFVISYSADRTAIMWDALSGKKIKEFDLGGEALFGDLILNDKYFAVFLLGNNIKILDIESKQIVGFWSGVGLTSQTTKNRVTKPREAQFSKDGKRTILALHGNTALIQSILLDDNLHLAQEPGRVVTFSPNGEAILTASDPNAVIDEHRYSARLFNSRTGAVIAALGSDGNQRAIAKFSPNGKQIYSGAWNQPSKLFDASAGIPIGNLEKSSGNTGVQFSRDGKLVLVKFDDAINGGAKIFDAHSGAQVFYLGDEYNRVIQSSLSPDGSSIAIISRHTPAPSLSGSIPMEGMEPMDNVVQVWDIAMRKLAFSIIGHSGPISTIFHSNDGKYIVTDSIDDTTRVWDAVSGQPITTLKGRLANARVYGDNVNAYSADGRRILTVEKESSCVANLWDIPSGRLVAVINKEFKDESRVLALAFSQGGKRLITICRQDSIPRIFNGETGSSEFVLHGESNISEFSPDGSLAVTASPNGTVYLWDVAYGAVVAVFEGHKDQVYSVAFDQKGDRLVTTSKDGTGRIWQVPTTRSAPIVLAASRMLAPRSLTDQEKEELFLDTKEDNDPVFGSLVPKGNADEHRRLAEEFEKSGEDGKPNWAEALYHHAMAARLYALNKDERAAAYETARRATVARRLSLPEAAAVWQRLWADAGGATAR